MVRTGSDATVPNVYSLDGFSHFPEFPLISAALPDLECQNGLLSLFHNGSARVTAQIDPISILHHNNSRSGRFAADHHFQNSKQTPESVCGHIVAENSSADADTVQTALVCLDCLALNLSLDLPLRAAILPQGPGQLSQSLLSGISSDVYASRTLVASHFSQCLLSTETDGLRCLLPSSESVGAPSSPRRPESGILQRRSSSVLNSMTLSRKLHLQPSKLDLIDDTTLTSLPLPPPPPKSRIRRGELALSGLSRNSECSVPDAGPIESLSLRPNDVETIQEISDDYDTTAADETFEENHDPIVLVEDYMKTSSDIQCVPNMSRKASLATFKQRYMRVRSQSAAQIHNNSPFLSGSKRSISNDESWLGRSEGEDLEAIFGKIPGSDKLKHCDLCDKPLYEISSVISSKDKDDGMVNMTQLYNEFVCWGCINVYEQFLSELYETEVSEAQIRDYNNATTERLLGMFNSIRNTHMVAVQPPRKHSRTAFSSDLLNRLHDLSSMSERRANGAEWLLSLRHKLRWRRRLYNLLPNRFAKEAQGV